MNVPRLQHHARASPGFFGMKLHPRRVAIGELNTDRFKRVPDGREIVSGRDAAAFLEIDDDISGNGGGRGEVGLVHIDKTPGRSTLRGGYVQNCQC